MPLLRRCLVVAVISAVVVGGFSTPAGARAAYRRPVDIRFPTAQTADYRNDYGGVRSGGRPHAATDLFAPAGTPVYAARGGYVVWRPRRPSGNAGYAVQIRGDDGRTYAYYHLGRAGGSLRTAVAKGVKPGARVRRGQRIGWVGDSGNARGGTPHLHFEIHDSRVTDAFGLRRRNPFNSLRRAQGRSLDYSPSATGSRDKGAGGLPKLLRVGSRGAAVMRWQRKLNQSARVGRVAVDGVFGPATRRATVALQRAVGLGPGGLGVVGPNTRAAVRRLDGRSAAAASRSRSETASPSSSSPLLRLGSRGSAVARWQRRLNRAGATPRLAVDGVFGPVTHRATVAFQRGAGLGPGGLGVVGPLSRGAMSRTLRAR